MNDDVSSLEEVLSSDELDEMSASLRGNALVQMNGLLDSFLSQYAVVRQDLTLLVEAIRLSKDDFRKAREQARVQFRPYARTRFQHLVDMDELHTVKFMQKLGDQMYHYFANSYARLQNISFLNEHHIDPVLDAGKRPTLHQLKMAADAIPQIAQSCADELKHANNFEKLCEETYLAARLQYRKLRKKYLGQTAQVEAPDRLEEQLFAMLLRQRMPEEKPAEGPAIALYKDNCFLTETLLNIADALPKRYEKAIAKMRSGKATGGTKFVKQLDEGEVERFAETIMQLSHEQYLAYFEHPNSILAKTAASLKKFYESYLPVSEQLSKTIESLSKAGSVRIVSADDAELEAIPNPAPVLKYLLKTNFLAIRPLQDDVAPQTRVERDYAFARMKLLAHLDETIVALSKMNREDAAAESYAKTRISVAIQLKEALDDIICSDSDRKLKKNIRDDNEFYACSTGQHGSLEIQRAPAPRIKYEDVRGESFAIAKAHIQEVIDVASHPYLMRVSAPRGNVKSNILLIGPFGCGKSELARAIGADSQIIGINCTGSDLLTAFQHESVKNVKRLYEHAKSLRQQSRHTKPVALVCDEFDRLFRYGGGVNMSQDGPQMEGELQVMMDGVTEYEGVFMAAMTNVPKQVPEAILRRFKYIDVVGKLGESECKELFKMFLTRGLPIADTVTDEVYLAWAKRFRDAPGDVIGKVADEVHFKYMHQLRVENPTLMARLDRMLGKKTKNREFKPSDYAMVKKELGSYRMIGAEQIDIALAETMKQPQIRMQITKAKQVYRDAEEVLNDLSKPTFGLSTKNKTWGE